MISATERTLTCECSSKITVRSAEYASDLSLSSSGREIKVYINAPVSALHAARIKTFARFAHSTLSSVFRWTLETEDAERMEQIL